jgi:photosystem II stability/assembly factor-like uncharacterized protein
MKKLLLFISSIFTLSMNAQWMQQTSPISGNLYSVFAINNSACAAAGFQAVIKTTNAGALWSSNITITNVNFFEVHTQNPAKWYALSQNSTWFVKVNNPSGTSLSSGRPDSILSLHFANQACAIAVGTAGKIEATCDTGVTWQLRTSGTTNDLNAIWFADADSGCAVGSTGTIRRTTDAGNSWSTVTSGTTQKLNGIHFPTPSVGYIVGNSGVILKSTNAGKTWTSIPSGVPNSLNGVCFIDQDTGYVVGTAGMILKTTNGGLNWSAHVSGTSNVLNSVHFVSPIDGWAVGNSGTILKYTGIFTGVPSLYADANFNLYPNPAKDKLNITSSGRNTSMKIYNALGEFIGQQTVEYGDTAIDISVYQPGVYFIEFNDGSKSAVKKFVKE